MRASDAELRHGDLTLLEMARANYPDATAKYVERPNGQRGLLICYTAKGHSAVLFFDRTPRPFIPIEPIAATS